jgi:hypothetical protein
MNPAATVLTVTPGVQVRTGMSIAAATLKAGYRVTRDGSVSCAGKAAAIANKVSAQLALDNCRAAWAKDLERLDVANDVVLDAAKFLPAIDAGAKAIEGKSVADLLTALAAAAKVGAEMAGPLLVKEIK